MKKNYIFRNFKYLFAGILILNQFLSVQAQIVSDFENLTLASESYWNGSDGSGGFSSGNAYFYNDYNPAYFSSTGFSYSNKTDVTTAGYTNEFSAYTGEGHLSSDNYTVANAFGTVAIKLNGSGGKLVHGFYATNTTYAALSMKDGDQIAKKFGGTSGNDPDWFKLTITGYLNNVAKNNTIDFYLADYRFANNSNDYIVDAWEWVDLTGLGNVDSLTFTLSSSDVGAWGMNTPAYFALDNFNDPVNGFEPAAGIAGTSALDKDNSAFIAWATACSVTRGPQDISNTSLGDATVGNGTMAVGQPGNASGVVSLGDGGRATLTFANPITNGSGSDFAVFENGFIQSGSTFLELAFVEVSSDGTNFFRFPSISNTGSVTQLDNAGLIDATMIHNLAGKYVADYGTPFDLEEMKDIVGLDVNHITHVRIVDVVGSVNSNYATYDSYGNPINDPWPTAFASGGFDLDAVGVIHAATSTGISSAYNDSRFELYPNPSNKNQTITINVNFAVLGELSVQIFDYSGQLVKEQSVNSQQIKISSEEMTPGMYIVKLTDGNNVITKKLVIN